MRKALLLIITLLGFTATHAEDYAYLTIVGQDGSKTSLTAVGLSITFSDGNLVATNAYTDESKTIALSHLASMNFSNSDETTGIGNIQADGDVNIGNADIIYTLQGQQLPSGTILAKGLYILKKGDVTRKAQVR